MNCPHITSRDHYIRLESSQCEQKLWSDILGSLGADLYYNLAKGERCIVHDLSERSQETRACWQGLSWIRYACARAWFLPEEREYSRNGMDVTRYWYGQYNQLEKRVKRKIEYYRRYVNHRNYLQLESCYHLTSTYILGPKILIN